VQGELSIIVYSHTEATNIWLPTVYNVVQKHRPIISWITQNEPILIIFGTLSPEENSTWEGYKFVHLTSKIILAWHFSTTVYKTYSFSARRTVRQRSGMTCLLTVMHQLLSIVLNAILNANYFTPHVRWSLPVTVASRDSYSGFCVDLSARYKLVLIDWLIAQERYAFYHQTAPSS